MGKDIEKEMKRLKRDRDAAKNGVIAFEGDGYKIRPCVLKWLEEVEKLENEWELIQHTTAAAGCLNCILFHPNKRAALVNLEKSIQTLKKEYDRYYYYTCINLKGAALVNRYMVFNTKRVEGMMLKPSIEGQLISKTNLHRVRDLFIDDKVSVIGIWGMAGVGKTLLMKTLNDDILNSASKYPPFDLVIYVNVSQPLDLSEVQRQIGRRLGLTLAEGETLPTGASQIGTKLMEFNNFLITFDNVWKGFNLCEVGVPQTEVHAGCKVIITSRDKDVFTYISKDVKVLKVDTLNEEESWKLLANTAGHVVNSVHIEPIAKEIIRECGGLPLAIECCGLSMKNQNNVVRWECALESFRSRSEPDCPTIDEKVFRNIKRSYDSFEGESMCKGGDDIQKCFLDCALYPANSSILIDTLVRSWHEKGFIGKDVKEDKIWYIFGIDFVHRLINVSLLEQDGDDSVKMHPLVRHVAIWIAKDKSPYYNFF